MIYNKEKKSTWTPGRKVSQHISAQSITLLVAFYPWCTLVTGKVSDAHTPGHWHGIKEKMIHQTRTPSSIAPIPMLSSVDSGHHGHPDWSAAMQPYKQQSVMQCAFWHLSDTASIRFFCNMSNNLNHAGEPSLPTYISEPWQPMTLWLVHHRSFLGSLLKDTDHGRPRWWRFCTHSCV